MNIDKFLANRASEFPAVICAVDVMGCSNLVGSVAEKNQTLNHLVKLVISVIDDDKVWYDDREEDGVKLLYDASDGYDDIIIILDKVISLLPFFNRSRGITNFLLDQEINLGIICHCGKLIQTNGHDSLAGKTFNDLSEIVRDVGVQDHVVVTEQLYQHVSAFLKDRFTALDIRIDQEVEQFYILDYQKSMAFIQKNGRNSESVRRWVESSLGNGIYDELDIFAYTNETLFDYFSKSPPKCKKVRVLVRNWLEEERDENRYNQKLIENSQTCSDSEEPIRPWKKSHIIKVMSDITTDPSRGEFPQSIYDIERKFYDYQPLLKGVILRNSQTKKRAVHIGHYRWDINKPDGGSPYIGDPWIGMWLFDDNASQADMIDAFESRFDEMWENGKNIEQIQKEQQKLSEESEQIKSVRTVWEIEEDTHFLILVPGREMEDRPFPFLATEDLMCMRQLEDFLKNAGAKVSLRTLKKDDELSTLLKDHQGHVVFLCRLTLREEIIKHLEECQFPFFFKTEKKKDRNLIKISHRIYPDHPTPTFGDSFSPLDLRNELADYCVIGKCANINNHGKFFIIAGIHGMGTWGGSTYITDNKHLLELCNNVESQDFATLVWCRFELPQRIKHVEPIIQPRTF